MSTKIRPVTFEWSGNEMVPLVRFKQRCDDQFLVGGRYVLSVVDPRSRASHDHLFATIATAWEDALPERLADEYPSPEHLRKRALIQTGWCSIKTLPCSSVEFARELATCVVKVDVYAEFEFEGSILKVKQAASMDAKSMGHEEFQRCKNDVFRWISTLLGVDITTLKKEGNRHFPEKAR